MGFFSRLNSAWNAFRQSGDAIPPESSSHMIGSSECMGMRYPTSGRIKRSIMTSLKSRIANDCASISIEHVNVDEDGNYKSTRNSAFNRCLTLSSNIDQNARQFKLDIFMSLLDEGVIAVAPIDTDIVPTHTESFDILSMRVGKIQQWSARQVLVRLYDDRDGEYKELWFAKDKIVLIENPFYEIMNSPSSTLKRLENKLALLDMVDNKNANAKLDLIIQLPYSIKSPTRQAMAESRVTEITEQLQNSEYGIAYINATEHITQLNRAVENNLMPQIEYLTKELYTQLGISEDVFLGTANEETMLNYNNRIIEPLLTNMTEEFTRKFISCTGYTQGQRVQYYLDRFKLLPLGQLGDIVDKLSRNTVMSPNEFRSIIGLKASDDPNADKLANRNMPDQLATATPIDGQPDQDPQQPRIMDTVVSDIPFPNEV